MADRPDSADSPAAGLEQARALMDEALVRAEAGDWERVSELDAQCRAAVRTAMAQPMKSDPVGWIEALQQLRDRHRQLLTLAEAQRQQLVTTRRQSAQGRRGVRVYADNA